MRWKRGRRGTEGWGCEAAPASGNGGDGAPPPPSSLSPSQSSSPSLSPPPSSPPPSPSDEEEVKEEVQRKKKFDSEWSEWSEQFSNSTFVDTFDFQIVLDDCIQNGANEGDYHKLGDKELLMAFADDFDKENYIFMQKIKLLSEKYDFFRRVGRDGNCFYRAFIFSYLEQIAETQDDSERQSEAARLKQCVEKYKQAYESLGSLRMSEAHFLSAFSEFEYVLNLVEIGLAAGQLYQIEVRDDITSSILPFLRLLTEIEICTREDFYKDFLTSSEAYASVLEFCWYEVRPESSEANNMQLIALVNALGISLMVENLDTSLFHGAVQLHQSKLYPRPESEADPMSGPLNLHDSVSSEGTCCVESVCFESSFHSAVGEPMELLNLPSTSGPNTDRSVEALELLSIDTGSTPSQGGSGEHVGRRSIDDLSPAERWTVTLLYRPGHYDILYPK